MPRFSVLNACLSGLLLSLSWLAPASAGPVNEWLDAARAGDQAKMAPLLQRVGINATDGNGNTALIFAVREGHRQLAQWLISQGAQVNRQRTGADNWQGWTALMFASERGDSALLDLLLDSGAEVNLQDVAGTTALMLSACQRPGMLELLLAHGANPNAVRDGELKDMRQGWSATMYAVSCQNQAGIEALLAADANPWIISASHDFMSSGGRSEGSLLAIQLDMTPELRQFLLSRMIEHEKNLSQYGAYLTFFALMFDDLQALQALFRKGMPIQGYPDQDGDTPLHMALQLSSKLPLIQTLLAKGASLQHKNKAGQTPLDLRRESCQLEEPEQYDPTWLAKQQSWCRDTGRLLKVR